MPKPNVLLICVDEMRADHMRCAGNPIVQTPNLERDPDGLRNLWYRQKHRSLRGQLTAKLLHAYSLHTPLFPIPPWNS